MAAGPDATDLRRALDALGVLQDEATRLPNRRAFRMLAQQLLDMSARHHHPFMVFVLRVDNIDAIRAQRGDCEADWTLVAFAELLRATFRESDLIARLRDEEFVVVATETAEQQVPLIEERLAAGLESTDALQERSAALAVRVGAAPYARGASLNDLLGRASAAMRPCGSRNAA